MSQILTSWQTGELWHKSIITYFSSQNLTNSAAALREELSIGDSFDAATSKKYEGLLEKKWTGVARLQRKIVDLEASLQNKLNSATPTSLSRRNQEPTNPITCVAFHPVFLSLASGSEDATIKIWIWELRELERTTKGHTKAMLDVDFGDQRGNVYKNIRTPPRHDHSISAMQFIPSSAAGSPASRNLLVSARRDKTLRHAEWVQDVTPSFDSRWLRDASSEELKVMLQAHDHVVEDKSIKVWDARGTLIKTLVGHNNWVRGLVFHPGGRYLLSVSHGKVLKCWDLEQEGKLANCIRWAPGAIKEAPATNRENGLLGAKKGDPAPANIQCGIATGSAD
ncbi:WD40-repeat-containing domain protein [Bisporella sp. PMI_857]|nr:WD40-repeat-containing domain protein [Bisporella sp. PMI_857]